MLDLAWQRILRGALDRKAAARHPTLATVSKEEWQPVTGRAQFKRVDQWLGSCVGFIPRFCDSTSLSKALALEMRSTYCKKSSRR